MRKYQKKVIHHGFRPSKGLSDVRDPVFPITDIQQFLIFIWIAVFGCGSFIVKAPCFMQCFKSGQKFPFEKCGHRFSRQEEAALFLTTYGSWYQSVYTPTETEPEEEME